MEIIIIIRPVTTQDVDMYNPAYQEPPFMLQKLKDPLLLSKYCEYVANETPVSETPFEVTFWLS